jgi:[ribosomal protein S5]-alanine N-acetyltransferase
MPFTLKTERLILRDFSADDWPAVYAYASHPEVYRFQPWGPSTSAEAREYVEQVMHTALTQPRSDFTLAIELATTGTVIGSCNLTIHSQQHRHGEIGYFLHATYWGHGFATEVANRQLSFGFQQCSLHRIVATCDPRNHASIRVLEKIGMQCEGRLRETMLLRDGWRDSLLYSVLEDEWKPI